MNQSKAEAIIERASNTSKTMAVFLVNGVTKATASTTELFTEAMRRRPENLVGIYDGEASASWIVEDVTYCRGVMA